MVTHTPPRTDVFPSVTVTIFAVPSDVKTHASHKNPNPTHHHPRASAPAKNGDRPYGFLYESQDLPQGL